MFVGITNVPRPYAWGSGTAIAGLLGYEPSGNPEAELWLGAHPGSPARISNPDSVGGSTTLEEWVADDPRLALGESLAAATASSPDGQPHLPFLLKVLAANGPLSLQAHPSREQARAGFDRENEAGIPLDAPHRNFRDPFHKPEMIFALSDSFEALCGFRDPAGIDAILDELRALDTASDDPQPELLDSFARRLAGPDGLTETVGWLLRDGRHSDSGEAVELVARVTELAALAADLEQAGAAVEHTREMETVRVLAAAYPGDPGAALSLLLNRVTLKRGEALFLPAGNIHAYLSGLGIELMSSSDNVLRGGATPKHIDVDELLAVLDVTPGMLPLLAPAPDSAPGVDIYRPDVEDFALVHIAADPDTGGTEPGPVPMRQVDLPGPAVALCTAGGFLVAGAASSVVLKRGESVFITPDEGTVTFAGSGEVFLATTGNAATSRS